MAPASAGIARGWLPSGGRKLRAPVNWLGAAFVVALLVLWQLSVNTDVISSEFLPSPVAIADATVGLVESGKLPRDALHTLLITLAGWSIAACAGIALGLVLGLSTPVWRYSMASVEILRALPGITFVPLAVLLLGLSSTMELLIVIYVTIWPILINTVQGVRAVSRTHHDLAQLLRMPLLTRVRKVILPSAAGHLVVALRLGLATALALAVVAEMVGNPEGMGYAVIFFQQALQPEEMYTYIVSLGFLGLLLNAAFMTAVRLSLPGIHASLREGTGDA